MNKGGGLGMPSRLVKTKNYLQCHLFYIKGGTMRKIVLLLLLSVFVFGCNSKKMVPDSVRDQIANQATEKLRKEYQNYQESAMNEMYKLRAEVKKYKKQAQSARKNQMFFEKLCDDLRVDIELFVEKKRGEFNK